MLENFLVLKHFSCPSFIMFCKATLLTVALALVAAASPVTTDAGISIPLEKRSSLINEDGTFNHEKATYQTVKTIKYAYLYLLC